MIQILKIVLAILLSPPLLFIVYRFIVRIIRRIYPFPIPEFMAEAIDNPFRRRLFQPPEEMAARLGLMPGMSVLEVGPGSGTYTTAVARYLGGEGQLVTIDIEPKMVERARKRLEVEGLTNVEARVADVFDLPFDDGTFDAVYMIAVIGEIPNRQKAMTEFARVLKIEGILAFSEVWLDPDFPWPRTVSGWARAGGFRPVGLEWGRLAYWMQFQTSSDGSDMD